MTQKKMLWEYLIIAALSVVSLFQYVDRSKLIEKHMVTVIETASHRLKAEAAEEEENLMLRGNLAMPHRHDESMSLSVALPDEDAFAGKFDFILMFSVNDCMNGLMPEIKMFNALHHSKNSSIGKVMGYCIDCQESNRGDVFLRYMNPQFPVRLENPIANDEKVSTSMVFVMRSGSGELIDVHKPRPGDLNKKDTFYSTWFRILHIPSPVSLPGAIDVSSPIRVASGKVLGEPSIP